MFLTNFKGEDAAVKVFYDTRDALQEHFYLSRLQQYISGVPVMQSPIASIVSTLKFQRGFILPYFNGGSLYNRLKPSNPPLSLPEKLIIAINVAKAIQIAELVGIVHSDVTPSNILLMTARLPQGSPELPVVVEHASLCDFGVATDSGDTGRYAMSHGCNAPECQDEHQAITTATDVFAFGSILMYLISNRVLSTPEIHYLQRRVTSQKFHRRTCVDGNDPSVWSDSLTTLALEDIAVRCWNPNPDSRPTPVDLIADLLEIQKKLCTGGCSSYESGEQEADDVQETEQIMSPWRDRAVPSNSKPQDMESALHSAFDRQPASSALRSSAADTKSAIVTKRASVDDLPPLLDSSHMLPSAAMAMPGFCEEHWTSMSDGLAHRQHASTTSPSSSPKDSSLMPIPICRGDGAPSAPIPILDRSSDKNCIQEEPLIEGRVDQGTQSLSGSWSG